MLGTCLRRERAQGFFWLVSPAEGTSTLALVHLISCTHALTWTDTSSLLHRLHHHHHPPPPTHPLWAWPVLAVTSRFEALAVNYDLDGDHKLCVDSDAKLVAPCCDPLKDGS